MKVLAGFVSIVVAIFIVVAVVYAGYWAVRDLLEGYLLLDLTTRATLAGVAAIALAVGLVVAAGLRSAARLQMQGRLTESRLDLYRRALASCLHTVDSATGVPAEPLTAFSPDLLLLGGPAVIKAHAALQAADSPAQFEAGLGELIREMRRELGHPATYEESRVTWRALVPPAHRSGPAQMPLQSGSR